MTRGGRTKERGEPERRCIVTRAVQPRAGLIRFVAGPDDVVVPDLAEKLPGRGMWVSADAAALGQAAKKGHFARAAKRPVKAPVEAHGSGKLLDERVRGLAEAAAPEFLLPGFLVLAHVSTQAGPV